MEKQHHMKEAKVSTGHSVLSGDESPGLQSGTYQLHLPQDNVFCFESDPLQGNMLHIQMQHFIYLKHNWKAKQF